jgi:hypothetical protein
LEGRLVWQQAAPLHGHSSPAVDCAAGQTEIAVPGCGTEIAVPGGGTEIAVPGRGTEIAVAGCGTEIALPGCGTEIALPGCGTEIAVPGGGTEIAVPGRGTEIAVAGCGTEIALPGCGTEIAVPGCETELAVPGCGARYAARVVAVGAVDGTVHLFSAADGTPLAKLRLGGAIFSSCVICAGKIVVGCRDDRVYCIDILTSGGAAPTVRVGTSHGD